MSDNSVNNSRIDSIREGTKVREDRLDSVKFWLVVMVIAVHVFKRPEFSDSKVCTIIWQWIYIFAMPLFIFISGYFSRQKDKKNFWPSIWRLFEPLMIFHIIGLLFYTDSISIKTILSPWWVLWYLLSLIYWRLLLQFIPRKILKHMRLILVSTLCISILAGFLPFNRVLSLQRTLALMPFFFIGYYMRGRNIFLPNKYKPFCILFLMATFVIPIFIPQYLGDLPHANPYANASIAVERMFIFCLAVPMSIAFINVCYNTSWIAKHGRLSMQYYIYHALIIPPLMMVINKLDMTMSFVTAIIITIGITFGISVVLSIPHVKTLTNPSSL